MGVEHYLVLAAFGIITITSLCATIFLGRIAVKEEEPSLFIAALLLLALTLGLAACWFRLAHDFNILGGK